jgi:hypothetical protein
LPFPKFTPKLPLFGGTAFSDKLLGGELVRMDIVANIHYGYMGKEVGFTDLELYVAAGFAQQVWGDRSSGRWYAYGDEPVDQKAIQLGIELHKLYGTEPTYGQFVDLFQKYVKEGHFDEILYGN